MFAKRYHPLEGKPCFPDDLANGILFLADESKAKMVTGTILQVDGGAMTSTS